jgi:hypothetical protein
MKYRYMAEGRRFRRFFSSRRSVLAYAEQWLSENRGEDLAVFNRISRERVEVPTEKVRLQDSKEQDAQSERLEQRFGLWALLMERAFKEVGLLRKEAQEAVAAVFEPWREANERRETFLTPFGILGRFLEYSRPPSLFSTPFRPNYVLWISRHSDGQSSPFVAIIPETDADGNPGKATYDDKKLAEWMRSPTGAETDLQVAGSDAPTDVASIPEVAFPPGVKVAANGVSKPFRASTIQAGHTSNEQAIYDMLWNIGTPGDGEWRIAQYGNRALAKLLRLSLTTIKVNLKSLIEKLAIDIVQERTATTARVYRIYSPGQILKRRRAAALDWVYRNRQGVSLGPESPTSTPG